MSALHLQPFEELVVPFPFTDREAAKRCAALMISGGVFSQGTRHSVLAMITSAEQSSWHGDYPIQDLEAAGRPTKCVIWLKIFTLNHRRVIRKAGGVGHSRSKKLRLTWRGMLAV